MTTLAELDARLDPWHTQPGQIYQTLSFRCPLCRKGVVQVDIWGGKYGDVVIAQGQPPRRLWHAEQGPDKDWATLTITPSINCDNQPHKRPDGTICPGWHGHVTNGQIT